MIKKYTILTSPLGRESGLARFEEVVCNIELVPDNGQGLTMDKFGNLMFTVSDYDVVVFAVGTWVRVISG